MSLKNHRDYKVGILLARRDQYLDALDKFKALLKIYPNGLPDILISLYKQLKLKFYNLNLRVLIAELYILKNLENDALIELEECIKLDPEFSNSYHVLSKLYRHNKCQNSIIKIFENAVNHQIFDSSILDVLPNVYLKEKNHKKSIALFKELIERFPTNCAYFKTLASLYATAHLYKNAADIYKKIAQNFSEHTEEVASRCDQLVRFSPDSITIRHILVELHVKAFNPDKAEQHLRYIMKKTPSFANDAIAIYRNLLKLSPHNIQVLKGLALALIETNEFTEAIQFLAQMIETDANSCTDIIPILEKVLKKNPQQQLARELLLDIAIVQYHLDDAIAHFHHLLELETHPSNSLANKISIIKKKDIKKLNHCLFLEAKLALKSQEYLKVIELTELLINTEFEQKALFLKAQSLEANKKVRESKSLLISMIPKDPYNFDIHQAIQHAFKRLLAEELNKINSQKGAHEINHFQTGLIGIRKGDFLTAIEFFQRITSPPALQIKSYILISRCFLEMGRFDLASNQLLRAISILKDGRDKSLLNHIRYLLAISYIHIGVFSEAIEVLEEILESDIKFPNLITLLDHIKGQQISQQGHALSGFLNDNNNCFIVSTPHHQNEPISKKDNSSISFGHQHNSKGVTLFLKQQYISAEEEFQLAIQLDPNLIVIYTNLILLYIVMENFQSADKYIEKAEEIDPNYDLLLIQKGILYRKKNNLNEAIKMFNTCLEQSPNHEIAHLNLGDIYWEEKNIKQAFFHWEKANYIGTLFYLINRRVSYLQTESYTFNHWTSDFFIHFNDILSSINKPNDQPDLEKNIIENTKNNDSINFSEITHDLSQSTENGDTGITTQNTITNITETNKPLSLDNKEPSTDIIEKNIPLSLDNKEPSTDIIEKNIPLSLDSEEPSTDIIETNIPLSLDNKEPSTDIIEKNIPLSLDNKEPSTDITETNVPLSLDNEKPSTDITETNSLFSLDNEKPSTDITETNSLFSLDNEEPSTDITKTNSLFSLDDEEPSTDITETNIPLSLDNEEPSTDITETNSLFSIDDEFDNLENITTKTANSNSKNMFSRVEMKAILDDSDMSAHATKVNLKNNNQYKEDSNPHTHSNPTTTSLVPKDVDTTSSTLNINKFIGQAIFNSNQAHPNRKNLNDISYLQTNKTEYYSISLDDNHGEGEEEEKEESQRDDTSHWGIEL